MTDGVSLEELFAQLVTEGELSAEEAQIIRATIGDVEKEGPLGAPLDSALPAAGLPDSWLKEQDQEAVEADIRNRLLTMSMGEKIKLAMFGNSVARGLLIFNANKMIQELVLKNPRLGLHEIEAFLKNKSISDHVIRLIARSNEFMKPYLHKKLLVTNSKTPQDVSIKWVRYLNETDLKKLSKSKNVPHIVAQAAGRLVGHH